MRLSAASATPCTSGTSSTCTQEIRPCGTGRVTAGDIGAVVARFGTFRESPPTKEEALVEALTPPTQLTSYHPAFDRNGADPEANLWNLFSPDGSITAGDIGAVVAQFGHSCA